MQKTKSIRLAIVFDYLQMFGSTKSTCRSRLFYLFGDFMYSNLPTGFVGNQFDFIRFIINSASGEVT